MNNLNRMRKLSLKDMNISKGGHIFSIPIELINEKENWNVRDYENEKTKLHIRNIADAIKNGENYKIDPIIVFVEDGLIYVADGHCRRRAAILAKLEGAEIERLPAIERIGNKDELLSLISTSNKGLPLNPIEKAKIYKRYLNWGRSIEEIKNKVNENEPHIRKHLEILDLPTEIQGMIIRGNLAYTTALSEFDKFKTEEEAIAAFKNAEEEVINNGKKITPKRISGKVNIQKKRKNYTKKIVDNMSFSIKKLLSDKVETYDEINDLWTIKVNINSEDFKKIKELMQTIESFESKDENVEKQQKLI